MRQLVLITGSPRSGSTPIGRVLCAAPGVGELYEPFGPTGIRGIPDGFPTPGVGGFTESDLAATIELIQTLSLAFKPQVRPDYSGIAGYLKQRFLGSRTLYSYRMCKFLLRPKTIVWKDPRAFFSCQSVAVRHQIPVLVTMRSPFAHAASFKRMAWIPVIDNLMEIADYLSVSGVDDLRELWKTSPDPVTGASIQWNIIYRQALDWANCPRIKIVNVDRLIENPHQAYGDIFAHANLDLGKPAIARIKKLYDSAPASSPSEGRTHNWQRSADSVNQYWKKSLSQREQDLISRINGQLWEKLCSACGSLPEVDNHA